MRAKSRRRSRTEAERVARTLTATVRAMRRTAPNMRAWVRSTMRDSPSTSWRTGSTWTVGRAVRRWARVALTAVVAAGDLELDEAGGDAGPGAEGRHGQVDAAVFVAAGGEAAGAVEGDGLAVVAEGDGVLVGDELGGFAAEEGVVAGPVGQWSSFHQLLSWLEGAEVGADGDDGGVAVGGGDGEGELGLRRRRGRGSARTLGEGVGGERVVPGAGVRMRLAPKERNSWWSFWSRSA